MKGDFFNGLLEQLGPLLYDVGGELLSKMEADKRAKRRGEIRDALRTAAADVEAEAMTGICKMTSNFAAWLDGQAEIQIAAKSSFDAQVAALKGYEATLLALMHARPS